MRDTYTISEETFNRIKSMVRADIPHSVMLEHSIATTDVLIIMRYGCIEFCTMIDNEKTKSKKFNAKYRFEKQYNNVETVTIEYDDSSEFGTIVLTTCEYDLYEAQAPQHKADTVEFCTMYDGVMKCGGYLIIPDLNIGPSDSRIQVMTFNYERRDYPQMYELDTDDIEERNAFLSDVKAHDMNINMQDYPLLRRVE